MIVPGGVQEAEEFAAPPPQSPQQPAPSAPEPPDTGYGLMDELDDAIASASSRTTPRAEATAPGGGAAQPGGDARRPCPECGEMIVAGAAKCRFCGAVFDPRLKKQAAKKRVNYGVDDDNLNAGEWVLCILCSGIGCIVGIVYAVQGKPKGMKMVGISIAAAVIGGMIRTFIALSMHNGFR
jgi:hypothetical protein